MDARAKAPIAIVVGLLVALLFLPSAASAADKYGYAFKEDFGSASQPSFTRARDLSVDPATGDLFAVDAGEDEVQQISFSGFANGDKFTLTWQPSGGVSETTTQITYSTSTLAANVASALAAKFGAGNFSAQAGFSDNSPVIVTFGDGFFGGAFANAPQSLISCAVVAGKGSGSCAVKRTVSGVLASLSRYKPNGEADNFSTLGTNFIDGKGGADKTPQEKLNFGFGNPREVQVAIDRSGGVTDGDIYLTQPRGGGNLIDIFSPSGEYLGQLTQFKEGANASGSLKGFGITTGVAVDPTGAVYVGDLSNGEIHRYEPTANPAVNADSVANFPTSRAGNLASGVGPSAGFLFADRFAATPVKLDSSTGAQKYVVDPLEGVALAVDSADGTLFSASEAEVKQYDASGDGGATRLAHLSSGNGTTGIAVDPATHNLYVSTDKAKIAVYERVSLPEATTEAATGITGEAVILHGKLSAAGGLSASCEFQYTTEAQFKVKGFREASSSPCSPPGPFTGSGQETVSAMVEGLAPGTFYRFRLVAKSKGGSAPENSQEGTEGALAFRTLGPAIAEQQASEIGETTATVSAQLNPNGEATTFAVEYVTEDEYLKSGYNQAITDPVPPEAIGSGSAFLEVSRTLIGLEPDTAYHYRLVAANVATVHGPDLRFATYPVAGGLPDGRAYEMVSPSKKAGEVLPPEPIGNLGGNCILCLPGVVGSMLPMQSAPDGDSVLYNGQPFTTGLAASFNDYIATRDGSGWSGQSQNPEQVTGLWEAFSADLSRGILAQADPPLDPEAPLLAGKAFNDLYLWTGGEAYEPLITTRPPHRDTELFKIRGLAANAGTASSPAFTHIVFEANDALTASVAGIAPSAPEVASSEYNLYEWFGGQLRLVNVLPGNTQAAGKATTGPDRVSAISADGSRVLWSSAQTGHVYARVNGSETLEVPGSANPKTASADGRRVLLSDGQLDALNEAGTAYEKIADLAEGKGGFKGILGASEDLSRIYFVDTAALTPSGEENENGEHGEAGKLNLYSWHEGAIAYVAALAASDDEIGTNGNFGVWHEIRSRRTAQVTPDGAFLAFMSRAPLTGYDNTCTTFDKNLQKMTTGLCREVFEYATATGRLTCVSCNPSGLPPVGAASLDALKSPPGELIPRGSMRQPANLSPEGGGRLFFKSSDKLTASDQNGIVQDVYEYEPQGVGDCERVGGCISLISSGKGSNDSMFMDSSSSGDDAFFITRSQLVARDRDEQLDLYDARVGGGFEEEEIIPCEGEACKGPVTNPPEQPGAGSLNFVGPGNPIPPAPCPKGKVRRHGKCVKPRARHRRHGRHRKRAARHERGVRR